VKQAEFFFNKNKMYEKTKSEEKWKHIFNLRKHIILYKEKLTTPK